MNPSLLMRWRNKLKWHALAFSLSAFLIGQYYDLKYPICSHIFGPKWLIVIELLSFLVALIFTMIATPKWQSLIAWLILLFTVFHPREDPCHHITTNQIIRNEMTLIPFIDSVKRKSQQTKIYCTIRRTYIEEDRT